MNLTRKNNCCIIGKRREGVRLVGNKNIPMRIVKEKTGLTSRQIRYYHQKGLIFPVRTAGNQRLFSDDDLDRLKKIKALLENGYSIKAVKKKITPPLAVKGRAAVPFHKLRNNRLNKGEIAAFFPVKNKNLLKKEIEE